MIREHHEDGLIVQLLHHSAHETVHLHIQVSDHIRVARVMHRGAPLGICMKPEKHVLDPIGDVENTHHAAAAGFAQRVEEHGLAFDVNILRLLQESVLANHAFVKPGGIFRHTKSGERALSFSKIDRVRRGMRNRQSRMARVNLDWRYVEADMRGLFEDQETSDGFDRESHGGGIGERHPRRIPVGLKCERLIGQPQLGDTGTVFREDDGEGDA